MPKWMRKFFKFLNRFFMVPMFRLGLGGVMTNPFSGYIMVMKTIGRKSGKTRFAPVNYAIWNGKIYCLSGGRTQSDWYKNLLVHPCIEVIMPAGGVFVEVQAPYTCEDRLLIIRQILKNAGFAGFFEGYNPWKITDQELAEKTTDLPLIELNPTGIGAGACDPHGWAWIGWLATAVLLFLFIIFA